MEWNNHSGTNTLFAHESLKYISNSIKPVLRGHL